MAGLTPHIVLLMDKLDFPEACVADITAVVHNLEKNAEYAVMFDKAVNDYMFPETGNMEISLKVLAELSEKYGDNVYTLNLVFLLHCTEEVLNRYRKAGISEDIYWASMRDLRYKMLECVECHGATGSFVPTWYNGFFRLDRFALGRFQYEQRVCDAEGGYTMKSGFFIPEDSPVLNFHIPSSGVSLTDDVRLDSYKKAYEFYKDLFGGKPAVFCCSSWLLYERHREFLPKNSNILRFMDDFEIIRSDEQEVFKNCWRIFGRYNELPYDQYPEDTSLRRAYKQWLVNGNKGGNGFGYIVFDGEKIIK